MHTVEGRRRMEQAVLASCALWQALAFPQQPKASPNTEVKASVCPSETSPWVQQPLPLPHGSSPALGPAREQAQAMASHRCRHGCLWSLWFPGLSSQGAAVRQGSLALTGRERLLSFSPAEDEASDLWQGEAPSAPSHSTQLGPKLHQRRGAQEKVQNGP